MPPEPNDPPRQRRQRSRVAYFSVLKRWVLGAAFWLVERAPRPVLERLVRAGVGVLRRAYRVPGNPLRTGIEAIVTLAARAGIAHEPRAIYARLLDQVRVIGLGFVEVYAQGPELAVARTSLPQGDVERMRDLLKRHDGLLLAVSHNVGSVYGAMWLSRAFPTLVIARNQKEPRNARFARDFFSRMHVEARLLRETGLIEFIRSGLREGKVVVATLDLIHRKRDRVTVTMWGEEVALAPWAFRLAAETHSPVLPCYIRVDGDRVGGVVGEPLLDESPERLAQHYASFLEREILRDPASWIFVADKRWRALVVRAAARKN